MTEIRTPSPEEMRGFVARARRDGAVSFGAGVARVVGAVTGFLRGLAAAFAEAQRRRALYEELSRMSESELRDVGLTRADIPAVVAGIYTRDIEAPEPTVANDATGVRPDAEPGASRPAGKRLAA